MSNQPMIFFSDRLRTIQFCHRLCLSMPDMNVTVIKQEFLSKEVKTELMS
jgi:hypothetical protein